MSLSLCRSPHPRRTSTPGRRNAVDIVPGSIWTPNDKRRWDRFVVVIAQDGDAVLCGTRFPRFKGQHPVALIPTRLFFSTGRSGYSRLR
jgi:hypothetical protein